MSKAILFILSILVVHGARADRVTSEFYVGANVIFRYQGEQIPYHPIFCFGTIVQIDSQGRILTSNHDGGWFRMEDLELPVNELMGFRVNDAVPYRDWVGQPNPQAIVTITNKGHFRLKDGKWYQYNSADKVFERIK